MDQKVLRTILSVAALVIFGIIITGAYSKFTNGTLKPKADKLANQESLKRVAEEAEKYFEENQHFGVMANTNPNGDCFADGTFISNSNIVQNILNKFDESKCNFNLDQNGSNRVNNWNITVRSGSSYTCIDSLGKVSSLNSFPQGITCE